MIRIIGLKPPAATQTREIILRKNSSGKPQLSKLEQTKVRARREMLAKVRPKVVAKIPKVRARKETRKAEIKAVVKGKQITSAKFRLTKRFSVTTSNVVKLVPIQVVNSATPTAILMVVSDSGITLNLTPVLARPDQKQKQSQKLRLGMATAKAAHSSSISSNSRLLRRNSRIKINQIQMQRSSSSRPLQTIGTYPPDFGMVKAVTSC